MFLSEEDLRQLYQDTYHYIYNPKSSFGNRDNIGWITGTQETIHRVRYLNKKYGLYELSVPSNSAHLPHYRPNLLAIEWMERMRYSDS